jgi:hypothetical protein
MHSYACSLLPAEREPAVTPLLFRQWPQIGSEGGSPCAEVLQTRVAPKAEPRRQVQVRLEHRPPPNGSRWRAHSLSVAGRLAEERVECRDGGIPYIGHARMDCEPAQLARVGIRRDDRDVQKLSKMPQRVVCPGMRGENFAWCAAGRLRMPSTPHRAGTPHL